MISEVNKLLSLFCHYLYKSILLIDLDSLSSFLYSFNEYQFNANKSVPGGIVNGKTVYLDSVTEFNNKMLDMYGYVNREDSNYLMIMPTNTVWKSLYDEYIKYFNYDNKTTKRD